MGESISNCEEIPSALNRSKHLKGQLDPPVSDKKCMCVTKNDHFLKLKLGVDGMCCKNAKESCRNNEVLLQKY